MRVMVSALALMTAAVSSAGADEGMWTFNHFPSERVEKAYGFRPDQAWLDHVRLSTLRIPGHCSASFVSPHGLVLTNHHCVSTCIQSLSASTKQDLFATGYSAKQPDDELKCAGLELDEAIAITDVTERMNKATAGKDGPDYTSAFLAERGAINGECVAGETDVRCEVIELHGGGMYNLYRNRVYRDVRLIFAPERAVADFGGDVDDFHFPHTSLDVAFLRVFADGKPLNTAGIHLRPAKADVQPSDITFAAGSPGFTLRPDTVARLEFRRDVELPRDIFYDLELRGLMTEFSAGDPDRAQAAAPALAALGSKLKYNQGRFAALAGPNIIRLRAKFEEDLRQRVAADPLLQAQFGDAWNKISDILDDFRNWRDRYQFTAGGHGFQSELFDLARKLLRQPNTAATTTPVAAPSPVATSPGVAPSATPSSATPSSDAAVPITPSPDAAAPTTALPDPAAPAIASSAVAVPTVVAPAVASPEAPSPAAASPDSTTQSATKLTREITRSAKSPSPAAVLKSAPASGRVDAELEKLNLAFSMTQLRESLGPDDVLVKKVLGAKSPRQRAAELIDGTGLGNAKFVRALTAGGADAISNSADPMMVFARQIDPDLRTIEQTYARDVEQPLARHLRRIQRAAFAVYGTAVYPDASYSPRLSYGSVSGYRFGGQRILPVTRTGTLFERATDADPYRLPPDWLAARTNLDPQLSLNFVTTNDVIGGNSGSPVINKAGEIVGVMFDINYPALGGYFAYDPSANRAIGVSMSAIRQALTKVYHADRLAAELVQ